MPVVRVRQDSANAPAVTSSIIDGSGTLANETWTIADDDGQVALTFMPRVQNEVMINIAGVFGSEYYGPFGDFTGSIHKAS